MIVISSPELMEPILSSHELITKGVEYSYLTDWLGTCLFLSTGKPFFFSRLKLSIRSRVLLYPLPQKAELASK